MQSAASAATNHKFQDDDLAWAKMPPFPWWPCTVTLPEGCPDTSGLSRIPVRFFGEDTEGKVKPSNIQPFKPSSRPGSANVGKYAMRLSHAIEEAETAAAQRDGRIQPPSATDGKLELVWYFSVEKVCFPPHNCTGNLSWCGLCY